MSVEDAAVYLGRTRRAVESLVAAKAFPAVRADRRVQLDRVDLDDWIARSKE